MVSVIVPVYNTALFLRDCVKSILCQSYTDFELLLIDDGSTDNSLQICNELKETDGRIFVYHKENGGQSSARNFGIDVAKGDFFAFVDSDDIICPDFLRLTLHACEASGALIAQTKLQRFVFSPELSSVKECSETVLEFQKCYETTNFVKFYDDSICNKLFHRSLFVNNRFIEGEIFEDGKIVFLLWLDSKKQVNCDFVGYYYRNNLNSTLGRYDFAKNHEQVLVWEKRRNFYQEHLYENHIQEIEVRLLSYLLYQYFRAKQNGESKLILQNLKCKIRSYYKAVKKSAFLYARLKLLSRLFLISPTLYYCLYAVYSKL